MGSSGVETGQSLVPEPPERITGRMPGTRRGYMHNENGMRLCVRRDVPKGQLPECSVQSSVVIETYPHSRHMERAMPMPPGASTKS